MMTSDFWLRIRRLFRRRAPSREIERIVAGWRADEPPEDYRSARKRERLDLVKGWVTEDPEQLPDRAHSGPNDRRPKHGEDEA